MITSPRNASISAARSLRARSRRERTRRFLAEGPGPVAEAIEAGAVETIFVVPGAAPSSKPEHGGGPGAPAVREVTPEVMARLAGTVSPQGPVAVCRFVDVPLDSIEPANGPVVFLWQVRDPGNAGAIIRTADAAGSGGVVVSAGSVDVYNEKTVRATAGSLFHLPVTREADPARALGSLRARGATVLAASAEGGDDLFGDRIGSALAGPVAVVFGNEARGLDRGVRDLADGAVRIPMSGAAESLNLAAAAAVILFEAARVRRAG